MGRLFDLLKASSGRWLSAREPWTQRVSSLVDASQVEVEHLSSLVDASQVEIQRLALLVDELTAPAQVEQNWYIDGVNGSDSNTGDELTSPLRSHAELQRRIGLGAEINQYVIVHVLSDLDEVVRPDVHIKASGTLNYIASVTETLASGHVTQTGGPGVSVLELDSVTDWDTAGPGGTSLIGELVRDTVLGTHVWLAKKLSNPAQARVSTGMIWNEETLSGMVSSTFGNGNLCVVEKRAKLLSIDLSRVTVDGYRAAGVPGNPLHLTGFRINPGRILNLTCPNFYQPMMLRCLFQDFVRFSNAVPWLEQCRFAGDNSTLAGIRAGSGSSMKLGRACIHKGAIVEAGGSLGFSNNAMLQDAPLDVLTGGSVFSLTFDSYNTTNYAVRIRPGGHLFATSAALTVSGVVDGGVALWVEGGGLYTYPASSPPALAGAVAGQDFRLGRQAEAAQAWAALGATGLIDLATGAALLPHDD